MKLKGKTLEVDIEKIEENPWNPNRMTDRQFEAVQGALEQHGQVAPVVGRRLQGGRFQILDGAHRFRAVKESGAPKIMLHDLGKVDDETAKRLTIIFGRTRGEFDPLAYGEVLQDLREAGIGFEDLEREIADDASTLEALADALDYDWDFNADQQKASGDDGETPAAPEGDWFMLYLQLPKKAGQEIAAKLQAEAERRGDEDYQALACEVLTKAVARFKA